jgi:hypothetical protein
VQSPENEKLNKNKISIYRVSVCYQLSNHMSRKNRGAEKIDSKYLLHRIENVVREIFGLPILVQNLTTIGPALNCINL